MNLTTIYSSGTPVSCHILKGRLNSEGLDVFIHDENIVWVDPFKGNAVGGVKLKVPEDQVENACRIMEGVEHGKLIDRDGEYELADALEKSMVRTNENLEANPSAIAKEKQEENLQDKKLLDLKRDDQTSQSLVRCPACKSEDVSFGYAIDNRWNILHFVFSVLIMAPLPLFRKNYHCFDCGADFKYSINK